MKTFLAENLLGVRERGEEDERREREREREARAGGIKTGLILIFKFCGKTTVRGRRKHERGKATRTGLREMGRNEKRREWPRITDSRTHKF